MFRFLPLLLWIAGTATASNQHEHYYSFPTTQALLTAYENVTGKKADSLPFGPLTEKRSLQRPGEAILSVFGEAGVRVLALSLGVGETSPELEQRLGKLTLGEVAERLAPHYGKSPESIRAQLFEFGPQSLRTIRAYKFNEDLREAVFLEVKKLGAESYGKFVERSFEETLKQTPERDRRIVALSVPADLFDAVSLRRLQDTFQRQGSKAEFLFSYPRYKLLEKEEIFLQKKKLLQESLEKGWAHGVDITGSIEEASATADSNVAEERLRLRNEYLARMRSLTEAVTLANRGVVKFHAFEATREGPFYDAFWTLLEGWAQSPPGKRPGQIVIGHIAKLTPADIARFQRLAQSGLGISFDANLSSNEALQGLPMRELAKTILALVNAGLPVGLGGDGQGILRRHSLKSILEGLKKELPANDFRRVAYRLLHHTMASRADRKGGPCEPWNALLSRKFLAEL